ncbi:glucan-binding repeat-containing protein [Oribacterium sp. KHPX15]|uniref:tetratricopeptide repeat protein n=1 Tax=Oribacterium sp. KHPX15 TaxID=1855342 RepID=UPI00089A90B7|nr:tetratricopeptide repeat protein [Oribacterium sp. KHPX15]SDZ96217.1 glucan-binding repeat-containing protein [Oribacterium sp. KHPX15]
MEKKSSPIIIICVLTGLLLVALVGMLIFFNLPAQRIRRMLKTANKHIAEENYDEAILTLQKMIEIDPKNENLYIMLADTYEKNGDIDKEVEFLQEAVTLMPEKQKISEVLLDVYPEVTLSKNSGTYTDPVTLSMSSSGESEIFYKLSGSNNESKYSSPIEFGKNGEYTIEYYALSENGYEGEHKTATYTIKLDESKYHFNEWVDESNGRHYYDENGVSVTGWLKLKGKWYLFDGNGVMLTGFREDKGNTYYLRSDGIMVIGWQDINGKRYYFDESGAMLKNQWIDDTFYVGADGAMLVDTVTPDGITVDKDGRKRRKLTNDQACDAFENYLDKEWPQLKEMTERGVNWGWWLMEEDSDENQVVILFRSYTGAYTYYYIDRYTGETLYRCEQLPDGTPIEEPFEKMNIWDYVY